MSSTSKYPWATRTPVGSDSKGTMPGWLKGKPASGKSDFLSGRGSKKDD